MTDTVELHVDRAQKRLKKIVATIDSDVKTGKDARELHDFVQDEMLPVMQDLAHDIRSLAEIVMDHDEQIADFGPDPTMTSILPEHAKELVDHLEACNSLFTQMVETVQKEGADTSPLQQRIDLGKALVEFVHSVTASDEDDEIDDEDAG
jgi:hypothetical protein